MSGYQDHGDRVTLDLHGHDTRYVIDDLVPDFIEVAWLRGYAFITIIHGSPDVQSPFQELILGRGSMKRTLRGDLSRGNFMSWAWNRRSVKHSGLELNSGAMTLALRPNPEPAPETPWPEIVSPVYAYEGPWHRSHW